MTFTKPLPEDRDVSITLTSAQVSQVLMQSAGSTASLAAVLAGVVEAAGSVAELLAATGANYSRSTLRAVLLLGVLPADGSWMGLGDAARRLEANASTTHRYMKTWVALGLVEQDPRTRRYRRAGDWLERAAGGIGR